MFWLAKRIIKSYKRNEFTGAIIYGRQGVGKSSYALKIAKEVLGDWDKALEICFFDIREFIEFLEEKDKYPIAIIDDAGVWLSKYLYFRDIHYTDYITALIHVIRTKISGLLLTTPDPQALLKSIRAQDFYYTKLVRRDNTYRVAKIYSQVILPTGYRYVILRAQETFNVMLPDDVYHKYMDRRNDYINEILPKLKEKINIF